MNNTIFINEQKRATKAFDFASKVGEDDAAKYTTVVKKFPMMVKVNGLTYALAFAYSKRNKSGETGYKIILEQIYDWLRKEPQNVLEEQWRKYKPQEVLEKIWLEKKEKISANQKSEILLKLVLNQQKVEDLMWTTQEVIKLFSWLKRFVGEEN